MEKDLVYYIKSIIKNNELLGIEYDDVMEKFNIDHESFIGFSKNKAWMYGLKAIITKDCIFFSLK